METDLYIKMLQSAYQAASDKNQRYSLRAFAKTLDIDSSLLTKVMTGKQVPSVKQAERLTAVLGLKTEEQDLFLNSVATALLRHKLGKKSSRKSVSSEDPEAIIDEETLQTISKLYHYALLELTLLDDFESDTKWIARKLNLTHLETQYAVDRLLRLGLLQFINGRLQKTSRMLATRDKSKTGPAYRLLQREILQHAMTALEKVSLERRSQIGMTMAIDPQKIPAAKEMIQDFNRKL